MRHLVFFFTVLLLYTSLQASGYLRSVRVASFSNINAAKEAMVSMEKFLYKKEEFLKLQKENQLELKIIPSGKYYLLVIEPFTNRKVMQKVLDIVRERYRSAYPKKLLSYDFSKLKEKDKRLKLQEGKDIPKEERQKLKDKPQEPAKTQQDIMPKIVTTTQKQVVVIPVKRVESSVQLEEKAVQVFPWYEKNILLLALFCFVLLLILLIAYRVKNRKLQNKNAILQSVIEAKTVELQSKECVIEHIAHELRTPMTAISGLSHVILENELPAFQKENIQNIENSANKAIEVINDILDVTKNSSGEIELEYQEFTLNSIVEHVVNTVYIQAKNNNVHFNLDVDDNVPVNLMSDSLRLGQVLINLLGNAIKFSKNGEVNLHIAKKETFRDNVRLEFKVEDTGIGMTQEELNKIFIPSDSLIKRELRGADIGLAISKELIEKMDGQIKVMSQKGVGTTFVFTIAAKIKDLENRSDACLLSENVLNKETLIIESSNSDIVSLLQALGHFKHKVHVLPSLAEDFPQKSMHFDIVILNQMNVSTQDINKLQRIHFHNRTHLKIILISERYMSIDKKILHKLDIAGFLQKPFTQESIRSLLNEIYGGKKRKNISEINIKEEKFSLMKNKKVLVVEENILIHKVIADLMKKVGLRITFVRNGGELVKLLNKNPQFDLFLVDIEISALNAYDTIREIRKNKNYNNVPILGLSTDITDDAIDAAFRNGMQGYIIKPIVVDLFYKKLHDALAHKIKFLPHISQEKVEELSTVMGLGHCNNDKELYMHMLIDFKKASEESSRAIEELCKNKNFQEAKKIVVVIKELALSIGAYRLFENLDKMEHELAYGIKGNWEETLFEYKEILQALLEEIDTYLEDK